MKEGIPVGSRIERTEQQLAQCIAAHRRTQAALVICIAFVLTMGLAPPSTENIEAQRLTIVDADGNKRIVIGLNIMEELGLTNQGANDAGILIQANTAESEELHSSVFLSAFPGGTLLSQQTRGDHASIEIGLEPTDGPFLRASNQRSQFMRISTRTGSFEGSFYDSQGNRVKLGRLNGSPFSEDRDDFGVFLQNARGVVRSAISLDADGLPRVTLRDDDGNISSSLSE